MRRIILLLAFLWLSLNGAQAQKEKRYGFTATLKIPNTKKEVLQDSALSWIRATLVNPRFNLRRVDEDNNLITGGGSYASDAGTTTFDLTFYFKDNVVDMVADNVNYTKVGRKPRRERTKGSPKRKTKVYLSQLSYSLEDHLLGKTKTRKSK